MNRTTYDVAMLTGTLLASVGAGLVAGLGVGLITAGGLVIALTIVGVMLAGKR